MAFGLSVFAFFFFGMMWRSAYRWRYLAKHYCSEPLNMPNARTMQDVVLLDPFGFAIDKGIVTIAVNDQGVFLRVMPIFSLFKPPLFIPHSHIQGWTTRWYLNAESTELQFRAAPDVKMVVTKEVADWLRTRSGHRLSVQSVQPPGGMAGQGWRTVLILQLAFMTIGLTWLAYFYLAGDLNLSAF